MTEQEWLTATDTQNMIAYLEGDIRFSSKPKPPKASDREIRLFACATCRRIWDLLDAPSRQAVEVTERFADAGASVEALEAARTRVQESLDKQLPGFPHVRLHHGVRDVQLFLFPMSQHEQNWKQRTDDDFEQTWGYDPVLLRSEMAIYRAFEAAIDAVSSSTWGVVSSQGRGWCTVEAHQEAILARCGVPDDDPTNWFVTKEAEYAQNTLLLRHISGNPFHPYPTPSRWPSTIVQLAEAHYNGGDCVFALHDALLEAGHADLADHFRQEQSHPKGCWVLDLILRRK